MNPLRSKLWMPLAIGLADLLWAASALTPSGGTNPASSVSMLNSTIWIFLHVPAVMLGSLPFEGAAQGAEMSRPELMLIGFLGAAQMAALAWWLMRYLEKKKNT